MKIGLSASHFPVTMARFFWEALERRNDVELYVTGPFWGSFIPWMGGISLSQKYVKTPNVPLPTAMHHHFPPYEMVAKMLPDDLDAFIQVDAGWHFTTRPHAKKVALVQTDPHVLNYDLPRSYSDYSFCMQTPYMKDKDIFLPYAWDDVHYYPEDGVMLKHDACLIGLQYEQRTQLVNSLRRHGLDVYYDTGKVFDEYRDLYNSSRVALCWSSLLDLPVRVFEAMGMARPLVVNRNIPDLHTLFEEGKHFLAFDSIEEGVSQVQYLIKNREFAETMRWAAHNEVRKHTWDIRVNQMLKKMGLVL